MGGKREPGVYEPCGTRKNGWVSPAHPAGDEPLSFGSRHTACCMPDAWPARAAHHRRGGGWGGPTPSSPQNQLKVPGSTTIGIEEGDDIIPPPSPHGPHAGPQAGSCIGAPQAGWQGCGCGAAHGEPPPQGERNSMNEGRRQLFALPKQLLQPGAAARLPRAIRRHRDRHVIGDRHMIGISTTVNSGLTRGRTCASSTTTPPNPNPRSGAGSDGCQDFSKISFFRFLFFDF